MAGMTIFTKKPFYVKFDKGGRAFLGFYFNTSDCIKAHRGLFKLKHKGVINFKVIV